MGSYRGAAAMCATTPKTVRRVIERHETDGAATERQRRARTYEPVEDLVADKVAHDGGSDLGEAAAARSAGAGL